MKKTNVKTHLMITVIVGVFVFCGCGSPYKSQSLIPADIFKERTQNAVNSSKPSWQTQQTLRLIFLDESYRKDHQQVISTLEQKAKKGPTLELRMAIAELALLEAQKYQKSDPQKAAVYYFVAAQQAYDALFFDAPLAGPSPLQPSFSLLGDIYDLAISELITIRFERSDKWDSKDFEYEGIHYHFEVAKEGLGVWDPSWFDYLYNSYEISVAGLENHYVSDGLGAPMVGIVEQPAQNPNFGRFYPVKTGAFPISAVLLFDPIQESDPPTRNISLVFYDSLRTESVEIQGQTVPLEADFTTPLGLQLRKISPIDLGLHNIIHSDMELEHAGVYMLEPYRPDKIPVVMVHGLLSSPATWAEIFNDLRGDPYLREKYQFWFFMYPTGLPVGYSASILRDQLDAVRTMYDPDGTNPYFNQMVMIGHSMGGLLTRVMVQDSGTHYWDYYFKEPFETIDLDPEIKQFAKNVAFFEHLPYLKRAIFISTPHRGSPLADAWYTRIASGMVDLPDIISDRTMREVSKKNMTHAAVADFTKKANNSLTLLSPSSVFTQATNSLSLTPDIPYHSIIGTRKPVTVGKGTSDGIVPYESSHLDFVVSEKLVPSGHGAHEHPLAIAEVKRILKLHIDSYTQVD